MFSSSQVTCDFCNKGHKGHNCNLDSLKETLTIKEVIGSMKYERDFEIAILWHQSTTANLKPLDTPDFEVVNLSNTSNEGAVAKSGWGSSLSI